MKTQKQEKEFQQRTACGSEEGIIEKIKKKLSNYYLVYVMQQKPPFSEFFFFKSHALKQIDKQTTVYNKFFASNK